MKIISRAENKKMKKQLKRMRIVLGLTKIIKGKVIHRLINRFCYFDDNLKSGLQIVGTYHNQFLIYLDIHSWIERSIICKGYYEKEMVNLLQRFLKPGSIAIDVGANIGCHTLPMSSFVGENGHVFAFEPNPRVFARLKANIALNRLDNVEAFSIALSDKSGSQVFFIPASSEHNQGLASLHCDVLNVEKEEVTTPLTTLDNFAHEHNLKRVDLVKIDTEGHEYQVLLGAYRVLKHFNPILLFEFDEKHWRIAGYTSAEIDRYLTDMGYSLYVKRQNFIINIKHGIRDKECAIIALPSDYRTPP